MKLFHVIGQVLIYLLLAPSIAYAVDGIYMFVDANGVTHLTNLPNDKRFGLLPTRSVDVRRGALRSVLPLPLDKRPFHDQVSRASRDTGLDSALIHAVISVESGYRDSAVSPKGAVGLMQLLPTTARRYGEVNLLDPGENIAAGARYLRDLMLLFNNDLELALAAYNAGENAVLRHGRRVPPYSETQRYIPLVLGRYQSLLGGRDTQTMMR